MIILRLIDRIMVQLLGLIVLFYRFVISPMIGPRCRYLPTCSEYALEALRKHGAWRGSRLALKRFTLCHPWGGSGYDPVPPCSNSSQDVR